MNKMIIAISVMALAVSPIFSQEIELKQMKEVTEKKSEITVRNTGIYSTDYYARQTNSKDLFPPENLTIEYSYPYNILSWDPPYPNEWIHWDNGNFGNGIGPGTLYVATRWDSTDLQNFDGMYLTKIRFFAQTSNCLYSLRVWMGENAANLLFEQDILEFDPGSWNDIELDIPLLIDSSQELWIGNVCTGAAYDFPAACDDGPAIQYKGDLISYDGINWASLSLEFGLDYNWNIRGLLSEVSDKKQNNEIVLSSVSANPFEDIVNPENEFNYSGQKGLQGYNIYHSNNGSPFDLLDFTSDISYFHETPMAGIYGYFITALYDEGESVSSDTVYMLLDVVNRLELEPIKIYPNPVNDILSIQARQTIQNIRVLNMSGKTLTEYSDLNKANVDFPVTEYEKGIYLLRIESGNEIAFRKIIIQ